MYITGYTLVLITISMIFKNSIIIDNRNYGIWSIITTTTIFCLNKTIKPLIVWITIPITALTYGLFYPFINILIIYITSLILGPHFKINCGILKLFIIINVISLMNIIIEKIINNIIKGEKI
jgi:putative membrane protein